jgi:hypothetical protein
MFQPAAAISITRLLYHDHGTNPPTPTVNTVRNSFDIRFLDFHARLLFQPPIDAGLFQLQRSTV